MKNNEALIKLRTLFEFKIADPLNRIFNKCHLFFIDTSNTEDNEVAWGGIYPFDVEFNKNLIGCYFFFYSNGQAKIDSHGDQFVNTDGNWDEIFLIILNFIKNEIQKEKS